MAYRLEYWKRGEWEDGNHSVLKLGVFETAEQAWEAAQSEGYKLGVYSKEKGWKPSPWAHDLGKPSYREVHYLTSQVFAVHGERPGLFRLIPADDLEYLVSLTSRGNPRKKTRRNPVYQLVMREVPGLDSSQCVDTPLGFFESKPAAYLAAGARSSHGWILHPWTADADGNWKTVLFNMPGSKSGFRFIVRPANELEYLASKVKKNPNLQGPYRLTETRQSNSGLVLGPEVVHGHFSSYEEAIERAGLVVGAGCWIGAWGSDKEHTTAVVYKEHEKLDGRLRRVGIFKVTHLDDLEYLYLMAKKNQPRRKARRNPAYKLVLYGGFGRRKDRKDLGVFDTLEKAQAAAEIKNMALGGPTPVWWLDPTTSSTHWVREQRYRYEIEQVSDLEYLASLEKGKH